MSKRSASTAATCSGCTAKFDPEIHVPFVGSCGDSICVVCVDEKKLEACPMCEKERAFAPKKKKKNTLAMELLMTKVETKGSKRSKLEVGEGQMSTEIACPGCSSIFDTDTHVPFVGSCGHSMCAVCLNENKITTCPVCLFPGGFLWKQKNELATDMLTVSAENGAKDSKKVNLDLRKNASGKPMPAILDPKNRHFLAQIVNQLNPTSLLTLSRSCKTLHHYCFTSEDIKITHRIHSMNVLEDQPRQLKFYLQEPGQEGEPRNGTNFRNTDYSGYQAGFLGSATGRKILQKYPFVFRLEQMEFYSFVINSEFYPSLRSFLAEFPIQKIIHVISFTSMFKKWNPMQQFLKDFHVESVQMWYNEEESEDVDDGLFKEAFTYLLQNLKSFEYNAVIDKRLLLNASVPELTLRNTSISKDTFLDLIPKLTDFTGEIDWVIGSQPFVFDYESLFSFNVKPFDYKGPLPEERPLLFIDGGERYQCWLLRRDGKVLHCRHCGRSRTTIQISMCRCREYPRCLRRKSGHI